jgi:hypothetical protein
MSQTVDIYNKTDDVKDSFCKELERVFDKFPKYHTKILLGDFNAKVGRENIFKLTTGSDKYNIQLWFSRFVTIIQYCHEDIASEQCPLYRQATTETTLKTPLSRTHFPTCSLRF